MREEGAAPALPTTTVGSSEGYSSCHDASTTIVTKDMRVEEKINAECGDSRNE
jgi:hypothetical protein